MQSKNYINARTVSYATQIDLKKLQQFKNAYLLSGHYYILNENSDILDVYEVIYKTYDDLDVCKIFSIYCQKPQQNINLKKMQSIGLSIENLFSSELINYDNLKNSVGSI